MAREAKLVPLETVLKFNEEFPKEFEFEDFDLFFRDINMYLFEPEIVSYLLHLFYPYMGQPKFDEIIRDGWHFNSKNNHLGKDYKYAAIGKRTAILKDKSYRCAKLYNLLNLDEIILETNLNLTDSEHGYLSHYFTNLKGRTKDEGMQTKLFVLEFSTRFPSITNEIGTINQYLKESGIQLFIVKKNKIKHEQLELFNNTNIY